MAGTKEGGKRAAATNKRVHGEDFYVRIGRIGGKLGRTGGFYANRKLASRAGRIGGMKSRRGSSIKKAHADFQEGFSVPKNASPQEKSWLRSKLKV